MCTHNLFKLHLIYLYLCACLFVCSCTCLTAYMWMSENNCRSQLSPSIMEFQHQTQSPILAPSTVIHGTISLAPCIGIILNINEKNNDMSQILQAVLRLENICLALEIWCRISHHLGMEVRTLPLMLTVGKGFSEANLQTGTFPNAKVR